jgi:hypothetical protein
MRAQERDIEQQEVVEQQGLGSREADHFSSPSWYFRAATRSALAHIDQSSRSWSGIR